MHWVHCAGAGAVHSLWVPQCAGCNLLAVLCAHAGVTVGGIGAVAAYVYQLLHVAFHIAKRGSR